MPPNSSSVIQALVRYAPVECWLDLLTLTGRECFGLGAARGGQASSLHRLVGRAPWDPDTKLSMCLMGVPLGCRFAVFWGAERDLESPAGGQPS